MHKDSSFVSSHFPINIEDTDLFTSFDLNDCLRYHSAENELLLLQEQQVDACLTFPYLISHTNRFKING